MTEYAELHCVSNFSVLRGASHPAELVTRAHELGYRALALTDECSLAGAVRAYEARRALPKGSTLQLIIGAEFSHSTTPLRQCVQPERKPGRRVSPRAQSCIHGKEACFQPPR